MNLQMIEQSPLVLGSGELWPDATSGDLLSAIYDREPDEIQQRQFNEVLRHERDFWCMTWGG